MPLTSLFIHRVEIQRAKSDKRQQVARDGGNDDMRLNSGQRGADRKGRQEEGINPRNSDGEPSSEPSEESQSSQEEVSWIQVPFLPGLGHFQAVLCLLMRFVSLVGGSGSAVCKATNFSRRLQKSSYKMTSTSQGLVLRCAFARKSCKTCGCVHLDSSLH